MIWWIIALALAGLTMWLAFRPISTTSLESNPAPVRSFEEAVAGVQAMQDQDNSDLARDVCITKLLEHGTQTEHCIVLLHGFTTCPEQFHALGKQYFEAGDNVLIPRMPHHGLSDRMTDALLDMTAENLSAFGDRVVDIAHGLGKKVTVMGLSGSATLACWLAQNRADVNFAFSIAPLFGLAFIPATLTNLFERIALLLPNFFLWWDPRTKADNPYSIYYAYPRYPFRALVEFLRLAMIVRDQARKSSPLAGNIVVVINQAEPAVSNAEILKLIKLWKKHGRSDLSEYYFEKNMKLPHDIITPGTPDLPTEAIHPRLVSAVKDIHARIL